MAGASSKAGEFGVHTQARAGRWCVPGGHSWKQPQACQWDSLATWGGAAGPPLSSPILAHLAELGNWSNLFTSHSPQPHPRPGLCHLSQMSPSACAPQDSPRNPYGTPKSDPRASPPQHGSLLLTIKAKAFPL